MSSLSLRNIDNATLRREAYSNNQVLLKIGNLGEFNNIQSQVNALYAAVDLSGGGSGPIQDVIDEINNISTEIDTLQTNQNSIIADITTVQQDISSINLLNSQLVVANADNIVMDSSNATVNADKVFNGQITFGKMDTSGFVKIDASGKLLESGLLTNTDFSESANISQSKLATIAGTGKVANRALSATSLQMPNAIAERDVAGNVYVVPQLPGTTNFKVANSGFVVNETNRLIDGAAQTLNTLGELATALGNDPNFFQNVNDTIATKAPILDASFSGNCVITENVVVSSLNTPGILRTDVDGKLYSSQLTANDLTGLTFNDSNLETITTTGKVASSATSASYLPAPNSIVLRDASGAVYGDNVVSTMYNTTWDKDLSWNTLGYYQLSKKHAPISTYALRFWLSSIGNAGGNGVGVGRRGVYAWSPELRLLVSSSATSTPADKLAYSRDFFTWTIVPVNDIHTYNSICWSNELRLFVAVGTHVLYSIDGMNWTREGVNLPVLSNTWSTVLWAAELGMFVAVAIGGGTTNRAMRSFDGKNWEIGTTPAAASGNGWTDLAWSPEKSIFVAVYGGGRFGNSSTYIMWSNDGLIWELVPNLSSFSIPNGINGVCWSSDLGMFYGSGSWNPVSFFSYDGKTWTKYSTTGITLENYKPVWSREYKMFFVNPNTRFMARSHNGINWEEVGSNNADGGGYKIGYVPECGFVIVYGGTTTYTVNKTIPSTFNLFDGGYAYTMENGRQYFNQINISTTQTQTSLTNTYGLSATNINTSENIQITDNSRFINASFASIGKVLTCVNDTITTANTTWIIPIGTRVNMVPVLTDVWTDSAATGTVRTVGNVSLPFGRWMLYYRISLKPDTGTVNVSQMIAGVSTAQRSTSFVVGSGSRYRDDFQRSISVGFASSYLPRTCVISHTNASIVYHLNVQLSFTGTFTNLRISTESYFYAVKIQ